MTTPVTHWYDRILPHCPGLDETMFTPALHDVMRDYFKRSRGWYTDLVTAGLEGEDSWDLDLQFQDPIDTYQRVAQIWCVYLDDRAIPALTRPWFSLRYRENISSYWFADQPNVLRLSMPLSADTTILTSLTLQPLNGIDQVPDFVEQHHDEAIVQGLLAYFFAMPAKPWSSIPLAAHHKSQYDEAIAEARAVAERAYTPADVQWTYPRSFV